MRVGSLLSLVEIDGTALNPEHTHIYTHPLDTRYKDTMLLESLCITKRLRFTKKKNEPSARSETATKKAIDEVKQICMRCVCVRKRARVRITIGSSLFCIRFRSECTTVPNTLRKKRIKGVLCFCFLFYYYFQFFFLVHVRSFKTAVPSSVPCADERDERNCCM